MHGYAFCSNWLTIIQKSYWANSPCFGVAIRELPSDFKTTCSFSKYFVLFPRLIYRYFITLLSTIIFDRNLKTFCRYNFISCVLKSEHILLIYLFIHSFIHSFIHWLCFCLKFFFSRKILIICENISFLASICVVHKRLQCSIICWLEPLLLKMGTEIFKFAFNGNMEQFS